MNANGGGSISNIIAGINHVVANCSGIGSLCIANMSIGGVAYNEIFNLAVADAVSKGVVVVVAAGNTNEDACSYSPASAASAITVGSSTIADEKSSFSNWGSCVDVYAPGSDITSSWNSSPTAFSTFSGTSMATPRKFSSVLVYDGWLNSIFNRSLILRFISLCCRCCWYRCSNTFCISIMESISSSRRDSEFSCGAPFVGHHSRDG
jgi:hypothetical protein